MIKTNFLGNNAPTGNMHYSCIACITIDSVMNIDKKNRCKYRVKKYKKNINTELKSDSESSDLDLEAKVDKELMTKLESDSD